MRAVALGGVLICLGLTACASIAPAPPARLAAEHRERALAYERSGDLRAALEEWKIALTIDPTDATARAEQARLVRRREAAVARRLRLGQQALRRGHHLEARRHLLAALALDPTSTAAFTTLREQVPELHFTTHTVARGETLGSIAERHYGDRALAEVIWEANRLPPKPRLVPGMRLKIPVVSGLAARTAGPQRAALSRAPDPAPDNGRPNVRESPVEEPLLEGNPLLADTHEALEHGEYGAALVAVDRLLESNPQNSEWLDLKKAILYAQGQDDLVKGRYDDAHRVLTQLAHLDPAYRDGASLLGEARSRAIQLHYNEGIRLSREEQLEAAIAHWHAVLEHDPLHAEAKRNIEQAQRILRALEDRKQP
ncbi:MAG TPA: LysM peptidoglycan-binding domain-containing protein [Methylomirabilota bacterium]|jgi:tetratricopeptide (TPR) repeat protein